MIRRRRLRASEGIRALVRETNIQVSDLIYPMFIVEGENIKEEISSMPGIYHYSIDRMDEELDRIREAGIRAVLLFGIPKHKDECGSEAYNEHGVVQSAIRHMKSVNKDLVVIADICLCEYTSHGHCGLVKDGEIINDETLELLAKTAVTCAKAGADMVAPSDMMDGHVSAIREALDEAGYINTPIMAYSAKMASGYYGPFRDAAHSAPGFGDRKTYQMDFHNGREAMRDIQDDIDEGADILIIKPALTLLDVLKNASLHTNMPLCVYNVSGEYAMVKAAAANGWLDEKRIVMENMTAFKRAGAHMIITYHALDVARWIREER
ncbi:MAG: porphobilinogen synthase [Eubacteriales bacterium]|nr:porphobilinogen synthase [Eubacteriales bacterium]